VDVRRRARQVVIAAALLALSLGGSPAAKSSSAASSSGVYSYNWPVKPFDRPHPVRGHFGDPRTTFDEHATPHGLMTSGGTFGFHMGVDIAAPDGTAVYPVRSGVAGLRSHETVTVDSGDGIEFEYWHIVPTVRPGQHVVAYHTVLGHVRTDYEHVHLSEIDRGVLVNPLAPGHMGPYADRTEPQVTSVAFRRPGRGSSLLPELVHGRVELVASAYDMPALRVPGRWSDLPVTPAVVTWRIEQVPSRKVVVDERTAFDVRRTIPSNGVFWNVYARGTHQNMSTFGGHRYWRQPAVYLFRLAASFDTRTLKDGIYALVVTAADNRGNSSSFRQVFSVHNNPSWLRS
jgi:hypothetical protein